MKGKKTLAGVIIAAIAVILLINVIVSYNGVVGERESIDAKFGQIGVRLQERHDKMGQMIAAIQGLEEHETEIYTLITAARAAYAGANSTEELINADAAEANALSRLLVVMEDNNPNITASSLYYGYVVEVAAMESALAVARRDYNTAVEKYNASVKRFPKVLYIKLFDFESKMPYWKMNNGADEIPMIEVDG